MVTDDLLNDCARSKPPGGSPVCNWVVASADRAWGETRWHACVCVRGTGTRLMILFLTDSAATSAMVSSGSVWLPHGARYLEWTGASDTPAHQACRSCGVTVSRRQSAAAQKTRCGCVASSLQLTAPRRSVRYACACITPKAPSDLARPRNCRAQRPLDLGPPSLTDCCALPRCSSPAADAATTPPQRAAEARLAARRLPRSRCTPPGAHPLAGSLSLSLPFSRACGGANPNTLRLGTPAGSTPSGITHPRDNTPQATFIGSSQAQRPTQAQRPSPGYRLP